MYQGSIVAMVTPMHEDGSCDDAGLARLVEFHIESATDAIVAVGTTGESATLETDEHVAVIERVVKTAAGRRPVRGTESWMADLIVADAHHAHLRSVGHGRRRPPLREAMPRC